MYSAVRKASREKRAGNSSTFVGLGRKWMGSYLEGGDTGVVFTGMRAQKQDRQNIMNPARIPKLEAPPMRGSNSKM